jgi:hypothetical protein
MIMLGLVFPDDLQIALCPEPDLNAAQTLNWRNLNLLGLNPAVESAPTNPQHLSDLHSGISLLLQYGIPYPMLSSENWDPMRMSELQSNKKEYRK